MTVNVKAHLFNTGQNVNVIISQNGYYFLSFCFFILSNFLISRHVSLSIFLSPSPPLS